MKSKFILLLRTIVVAYLLINLGFYFMQESLLFYPSSQNLENCQVSENTLYNEFPVLTEENISKRIRFLKFTHENAKANVILFHGNAGSACSRDPYIKGLSEASVNVILAEYPGYGGEPHIAPSEYSFLKNATSLVQHIQKDGLPVFLYGESLGTGVATYIASTVEVKGLILNHPYTSISDVARIHYPFLLVGFLNKNAFPAKDWAKKINIQPIVFQGNNDKVIPHTNIEEQLKNFKTSPIYHMVPGAGHNDLILNPVVFERAREYISSQLQ